MDSTPKIPHGYKQVTGQLQKGDGIWNGTRFAKVRKQYPFAGHNDVIAIRKCKVVQPELPGIAPAPAEIMRAHQYLYYVKCAPVIPDYSYDAFCKDNNLHGGGGSDRAMDYSAEIIALADRLSKEGAPSAIETDSVEEMEVE